MAAALGGAAYTVAAALFAGRLARRTHPAAPENLSAVTLLKPLHGNDPGLDEALASALLQDYPAPVQLVCGIQNAADPARLAVDRLRRRFPDRDIDLTIDPPLHGANRKISNLINMLPAAKYDTIVIADADIIAPPDWLSAVVAALSLPNTGAVTCLYTGECNGNLWSRLAAMDIGYRFLPNAAFGIATGMANPCFGATVALERGVLAQIGGLEAFANDLADDYEIGRAVRAKGFKLRYPVVVVKHICSQATFRELWLHELRWTRTIRTADHAGHWGSILAHPLPLGLMGGAILGFSAASLAALATVLAARLFLKVRIDHICGAKAGPAWLLPVRDLLSFAVFSASLFGGAVEWRGYRLRVGKGGALSQGE